MRERTWPRRSESSRNGRVLPFAPEVRALLRRYLCVRHAYKLDIRTGIRRVRTHGRQSGDLIRDVLQEDDELVEAEAVVGVGVVQLEKLADSFELCLRHWNAFLDP